MRKLYRLSTYLACRELTLLLLLFGFLLAAWVFAEIADEPMDAETRTFDERLLVEIRDPISPAQP